MKKINVIYWAFSIVITIILLIYSLFSKSDLLSYLSLIVIAITLIPNFFLKNKATKDSKILEDAYSKECDPEKYISLLEKQSKKMFKTKYYDYFIRISKADFLLEAGKNNEARAILEELMDYENDMNNGLLALYYKAWASYFLEYGNFTRVEVILEQLQKLATMNNKKNMAIVCQTVYFATLCKYNVLTSRDLNNAENFYASLVNANRGKAYTVVSMYYLTLIALSRGEYDKAEKRCQYIVNNGNKLKYVPKAQEILDKIAVKVPTL